MQSGLPGCRARSGMPTSALSVPESWWTPCSSPRALPLRIASSAPTRYITRNERLSDLVRAIAYDAGPLWVARTNRLRYAGASQRCLALYSDLPRVGISIFLRQKQAKCAKLLELRGLVGAVYFMRPENVIQHRREQSQSREGKVIQSHLSSPPKAGCSGK